jgi:hypothetical protein
MKIQQCAGCAASRHAAKPLDCVLDMQHDYRGFSGSDRSMVAVLLFPFFITKAPNHGTIAVLAEAQFVKGVGMCGTAAWYEATIE